MTIEKPLLNGEGGFAFQASSALSKLEVKKYGSLTVMLLGYTIEQVFTKRAANAAYYPASLTMLTAVLGVAVYPFIIAGAVATGKVTLPQVIIPWKDTWKPAVIGLGFTLHHTLLNVSAGRKSVPGIWIIVLGKSIVPMSMLLNMFPFTFALKYGSRHWVAVLILFGGVLLTLHEDWTGAAVGKNIFNIFLIVLAQLPMAAAFTFIEVSLKGAMREIFPVALWLYICVFQAVASWMVTPLSSALSHKGHNQPHHHSPLVGGMLCYTLGRTPENAIEGTDCGLAASSWWIFLFFAFAMNIAMPISTKYAGAALMWFVRALSIPLTGLLFASETIMGSYAKQPSILQVIGLAVTAGGILLFNSQEPSKE